MDEFPFVFERIASTTWAYLSSLLMLALFFKFNRFWSVRNFDLFLIILLAPGLLMVEGGRRWVLDQQRLQASELNVVEGESNDVVDESVIDPNSESGNVSSETVSNSPDPSQAGADDTEEKSPIVNAIEAKDTKGHAWQRWGYYWLFSVGLILLIRL